MSQPVQDSLAVVKQAQRDVNLLLKEPIFSNNKLTLNSLFDRLSQRLVFMGAVTEPKANPSEGKMHGPMKTFMGKQINRAAKVTLDQLTPTEADISRIRQRVQKLYDKFLDLKPEDILRNHRNNDDVTILRGVAKWAGVEDYETKALTVNFIEEISLAIIDREDKKEAVSKLKGDLSERKTVTVGDPDGESSAPETGTGTAPASNSNKATTTKSNAAKTS